MNNKVVIIGCGNVGMSYAYALVNQKSYVHELVLIDLDQERIVGEAMDLNHCLAFAPSKISIKAGNYDDCKGASIVCIAAGANQNPGETRMDLINKNSKIFKSIVSNVMNSGFNGIFLVATNPLDVMTYLTWKYSGLDSSKIIGSGTCLDSARLRYLIGEKLEVNPKNVHAYVIGEHGDSEFVSWSNASVGIEPITSLMNEREMNDIYVNVRDAAYDIIERKGATFYGIGMSLVRITNAILGDENSILTVSTYDKGNDIFIGLPSIVNRKGVREISNISFTKEELDNFEKSVSVIKEAILNLD